MLSRARSYTHLFAPRRAFAAAACLAGSLTCTQALDPSTLVPDLETRFARAQIGPHSALDGIIVLGGGRERMIEAVRLAKLYPRARLLISGRGEQFWHAYAVNEGIDPSRLIIETFSRNTYENAVYSGRLAQPRRHETWLLVTCAAHMPRAMGVFRKAGFEPLAWPVKHAPIRPEALQHEWLGLLAYRLLGRSDSLVPAQEETSATIAAVHDLRIAGW